MAKEIKASEAKLLRKRDDKLSRKQLNKFMSIHPNSMQNQLKVDLNAIPERTGQSIDHNDQKVHSYMPISMSNNVLADEPQPSRTSMLYTNQQVPNVAETSPLHGKFPSKVSQSPPITSASLLKSALPKLGLPASHSQANF